MIRPVVIARRRWGHRDQLEAHLPGGTLDVSKRGFGRSPRLSPEVALSDEAQRQAGC